MMKKISSGMTFYSKRIFPLLWFVFLAVLSVGVLIGNGPGQGPVFAMIPVFMAGFSILVMRKLVWDLLDEVYDCGHFLLVRNKDEEDSIPLANIMNVSVANYQSPPGIRITLRLIHPCKFGTEVAFAPIRPFGLNPFAKNPVGEDLIQRVHQARVPRAV